jgi:hypothetical protein
MNLSPAGTTRAQFRIALAFKPIQKPVRLGKRQHPTNLFRRHLCSPLRVAQMPVGEVGAAIQPLDRGKRDKGDVVPTRAPER